MRVSVHPGRPELGAAAAMEAAERLRAACAIQGAATLVIATGASQFEVLGALAAAADVPWGAITIFHLDEYVGLPADHPASFRRFLRERFIDRLPARPAAFHGIDGTAPAAAECRRLASLVPAAAFDLALIGIGENAHVAFNDPPADFDTTAAYLAVVLDEACRRQQVGEGWFPDLAAVPTTAISMSVRRILATRTLICSVPDGRKAEAVRASLEGPVTPAVPASILRRHPDCRVHLDRASAALLRPATRDAGPAPDEAP